MPTCPQEFICSISLEVMINPVRLQQTDMVYDYSSFHDWLTSGGTTCPLTGIRLRNPIILEPQRALRRRIWSFMQSLEANPNDSTSPAADSQDAPETSQLSREQREELQALSQSVIEKKKGRRAVEEAIQQRLAAGRLPPLRCEARVQHTVSFWQTLQAAIFGPKGGNSAVVQSVSRKPSTYCVTSGGKHVYCRGDL